MNNYPPGVSDNTYGAPWNDIGFDVKIDISLFQSFGTSGPKSKSNLEEFKAECIKELTEKLKDFMTENDISYKIKDVSVEDE